jgi:hypothetical protein
MNSHCYTYEYIVNERRMLSSGLDSVIDACYVLCMTGSEREATIRSQFQYVPVSHIYLQLNDGFKKCEKRLTQQKTHFDLFDAYKQAFSHALKNDYTRVLVIEDDCIFDKKRITDECILSDIREFIQNKNPSVYNLGPIFPLVLNPFHIFKKHKRLLMGFTTHAVIYNECIMRKVMLDKSPITGHIDLYSLINSSVCCYYKPLAYQLYTRTDNSINWGPHANMLFRCVLQPLGLHHNPQPGFDRMYCIMKYVNVVMYLIVIKLLMYIIHFVHIPRSTT